MDNTPINSILARCLLDYNFLEQILQNPIVALSEYGIAEDVRKEFSNCGISIRNFSAFIAMVQHNYLWTFYPCTRALLKYYKMEIEVFSAYLELHLQLRNSGATRDQKIVAFLEFFQNYLNENRVKNCIGLYDMLIHERIISEIRVELNQNQTTDLLSQIIDLATLKSITFGRIIPKVSGILRVAWFSYDPLQIVVRLAQGSFSPDELTYRPRFLVYWVNTTTKQLRIFEIDYLSYLLFSEVNGRRSIRNIRDRVRKKLTSPISTSELRTFFEMLFQEGIFIASLL
jgi:hypothetical protein